MNEPTDDAFGWSTRAPVQLLLLFFVVLAGVVLFPPVMIFGPLGFAFVFAALVFGAVRWQRWSERLFGTGLPIPGWFVAAILSSLGLFALLAYTERYTTEATPFVFLVAFCLPWVVSLTVGGRLRRLANTRVRLSIWLAIVLSALVLTGGFVFGWSVPTPYEMAVFAGFVVIAFIVVVVFPLTIVQMRGREESDHTLDDDDAPLVSVLVPAYNESNYVGDCLDSILASDYPTDRLEVIVIDDGSTDGTYAEASAYRNDRVSVFHRSNGGKHAALNLGLSCSRGDVVVAVDADSILAPSALRTAVEQLQSDPRLGAVAGTVVVNNADGIVGSVQALEYVLGINTVRRAFSYLGTVMVIPGCLGVFRREALSEVGGYDPDTVTEDFDLTVRLLKAGWRVELSEALVYTEAPFSLTDLLNQRLRWTRGNIQTLLKHRDVFSEPAYGFLHRFAFPLSALSILFVPFASIVVTTMILVAILNGAFLGVALVAAYFLFVLLFVAAMALDLSDGDWRLLAYAPLHLVGYRQFLDVVVIRTALMLLRGTNKRWESVTRERQQSSEALAGSQRPSDD
ncbi:glycosyltransferase [Halogeometricum borinquense]|uniref:Glycosyltransferase n=1 Tax=Halogeometricum borinquense TaxID=60847 RepID=A0A482TD56_9EURY|nr:glycosyltransferase family 2 protein [Halogeometricum borinquense]RYJ14226.1 glycosyltransferase [Halogeometricum borinquense]